MEPLLPLVLAVLAFVRVVDTGVAIVYEILINFPLCSN